MDILLIFVLPISTIILSIVLQKILKCPALVAATFFAIFLIVAYTTTLGTNFLIYVIIYTILSYVTAVLTRLVCNIIIKCGGCSCNSINCICGNTNNNGNIGLRTGVARNCNNNECYLNNNTNNSASFTVTSSQPDPVFYLTSKSNNVNNNIRNTNQNCCCRRR